MNVLVFDIETVPDIQSGRRIYGLGDLDEQDVASAMLHKRRQETGVEFLRLHLHKIVAISLAHRSGENFSVWSLGDETTSEKELIEGFYNAIAKYSPTIVSWNGKGFDLPVLHYRALLHGVSAPRYWESGDQDDSFRGNNYLGRYHSRHTDLMDVLAGYEPRAYAPLSEIAAMLGLPGKRGMNGARVWDHYVGGNIKGIRDYCESDVLNTYLIYLRFEFMRGNLTDSAYEAECKLVRDTLQQQRKPHLDTFLSAWQG
jgi:predicted PolB exonuclease-like 3'-5' exonuclease